MASTYLELVNKVLTRMNEVTYEEIDFNSGISRGIHQAVRQAVQDAVEEISQSEQEWPFNAYQHRYRLSQGVSEYAWPDGFRVADWNSFQLEKDDTLNIDNDYLPKINRDEWYSLYRNLDYNSGVDGRGIPAAVFDTHGMGFGVTPSPNADYLITFRYFKNSDPLVLALDEVLIPKQFDDVIVTRALVDMYQFQDNPERAAIASQIYTKKLATMRSILINRPERMTDTRRPDRRGGYI